MIYQVTNKNKPHLLKAVRDGILFFSDYTDDAGIPKLHYLHCIKNDSGIYWETHHLPVTNEYVWNSYKHIKERQNQLILTKKEKETILLGCLSGMIETNNLPRIFPLERKPIIGAILYSGFTKDDYTTNKLPDVPYSITKQFDTIFPNGNNWGICASFIADNIKTESITPDAFDYSTNTICEDKENIRFYQQMTSGLVFFL